MTTERPARGTGASPLELRLYLVALLGVVYTIAWRAIGGEAAAPAPVATTATEPPPRFVWIDTLPADARPAVALPAGWQRASASDPPTRVSVPVRRAPRVRTRSS